MIHHTGFSERHFSSDQEEKESSSSWFGKESKKLKRGMTALW